jgi:hypothetical protein
VLNETGSHSNDKKKLIIWIYTMAPASGHSENLMVLLMLHSCRMKHLTGHGGATSFPGKLVVKAAAGAPPRGRRQVS